MPKSCEVVGCTNHNKQTDLSVSFHKFPSVDLHPYRYKKWVNALKKLTRDGTNWIPSKYAVVCGDHFITGRPARANERNHPDWIPNVFPHKPQSEQSSKLKLERFQRTNSRLEENSECTDRLQESAADMREELETRERSECVDNAEYTPECGCTSRLEESALVMREELETKEHSECVDNTEYNTEYTQKITECDAVVLNDTGKLVKSSGFFVPGNHVYGDQILADRGFTLQDLAAVYGVELIIPAFTKGKHQLSAKEVETSGDISSVRIHIERIIGHMRTKFTILRHTLPINTLNSVNSDSEDEEYSSIDKIVQVCPSLINMCDSIVMKP